MTNPEKNDWKSWRQHASGFTVCLSAFMVGNVFGWSSFASPQFMNGSTGFRITKGEASLMESMLTLAAALSCFPAGWITDKIGRKSTLLATIPIAVLGWCLIICSYSIDMLYGGRFILGLCVGTVCVTAPLYTTEICQKEIRGTVGSYFQMMLAAGVLFAYVIGSILDAFWLSTICGLMPIIFGFAFSYFPETPVYFVMHGKLTKAKNSLRFLRDFHHDIESELTELSDYASRRQKLLKENIWKSFLSRQGIKSLLMSIGLMIFQQMSGINAFIFNATNILERSGSSLEAKYETIIFGLMQLIGAFLAFLLVDEIGRIMMLGISGIMMSFCTFSLGMYFYAQENDFQTDGFSWIPLLSLSIFVVTFSVGFGSVPWMMMPELIPADIKGPAISVACTTNWIAAFIVTKFFSDLIESWGLSTTLWAFCIISVIATIFTFRVLPETKGKSFEGIQRELDGRK